MNETVYVYIVHSDINENNIYAEFETEEEAIEYARRNKDELTYVDRVEVVLDEDGDIIEEVDSETIWVYDEEDDDEDELTDDEIEALIQADEDEKWAEADLGDTTWFEDLDTDSLVETLEENEDIVECKECFELFPKEACTKVAIGYICPECGKIHSHEEPEFEIDSIPDVVIADEDTFKIDFPEVERMNYGNDMIPDEPTPEVENDPISEPECVGPECEAPVEASVTKDETITKLVIDEHEAIDGYEKAKIEIEANSELDEKEKEEILDTIEHIKEEEIEHIEELEELVDEVEETKVESTPLVEAWTLSSAGITDEVETVGRVVKGTFVVIGFKDNREQTNFRGEYEYNLDTKKLKLKDVAFKFSPKHIKEIEAQLKADIDEHLDDNGKFVVMDSTEVSGWSELEAGESTESTPLDEHVNEEHPANEELPTSESEEEPDLDAELAKKMKQLKIAKVDTKIAKQQAKQAKHLKTATKQNNTAAKDSAKTNLTVNKKNNAVTKDTAKTDLAVTKAANDIEVDNSKTKVAVSKDDVKVAKNTLKTTKLNNKIKAITPEEETEEIIPTEVEQPIETTEVETIDEALLEGFLTDILADAGAGAGIGAIGGTAGAVVGAGAGAVFAIVKNISKSIGDSFKKFKDASDVKKALKRDPQLNDTIEKLVAETGEDNAEKILQWIEDYYTRKVFDEKPSTAEEEDAFNLDFDLVDEFEDEIDDLELDFDFEETTEPLAETLMEGSGFLGKVILDDYFKKDGQRNPENKNGTGYWVDLIDPDTKQSIIKPEDKKTVQKLKEAETIATQLSKAEAGWAVIRVEGAQGWNGILEVYEKGKRTQDVTQKKLANLNKAWDEQEAAKKARQALDKNLGKDKKDSENIDLPGNTEQQPDEEQNTPNQNEQEVTVKPKNAAAVKANKEYKKIIDALKKIGIATSELSKLVQGKKPTDALKELRKLLFVESLAEHVNEEHPAIESDQELEGIDNAVVDCEVADVITHSEDEKPLDCKMKKAPLEKPLTEDLSEDKLQVMEDYLKSTKFASLDTEWEEEGDFYLDIIGAYLDYSNRTNMFSLGLSIYHASEDNNAEYPERHTDEEEFTYDSLAEMYEDEECKEILDRLYEDNSAKLTKSLTETKCKDCGGELKDNKCTACNKDWNLEKCNRCGGEVKDGKCTHCDYDFTVVHCKDCGGEVKDGKCTSCNELVEAHRTGDFVKLVNDKFRTDQPVSVYDLKCWMKSCDLTVKQQGLSKINLIINFDNNCEIIQETEKAYLVSVPCYFRNPKDRSQILDTPNYIALWAPKSRCVKLDPVTEETHAQYAKPEGNRVQAYNNALKYAKKAEVPYIYGYSNHTGKFFALEQPIKVSGRPADAEKEFRQQYKNCKVVYVVYPDKTFLNEVLYNFTPEEQAEYGIDEEGQSLEGFDTYVRCNWCGEVYPEFDCKFEANLGWLCPRCQDEVRSHGGPLTIVEEPSEEQIQATLEN